MSTKFTCVGDAAVLIASARVIDDHHPHERGAHHTTHHRDDYNANRSPAILIWVGRGGQWLARIAVGVGQHGQA